MNYFNTKKDEAKAIALQCPISQKFSIELARELKRKPVRKALRYLDDIIELKRHVPLKRYNADVGHKKGQTISGVKSGRYPVKVAKFFKKILNAAISNADVKGLDKENLLIIGAVVSIGVRRFKIQPKGRRRSRVSKATNIEIIVKEMKKSKKGKAPAKKAEVKSEKKEKTEAPKEKVAEKKEDKEHKSKE